MSSSRIPRPPGQPQSINRYSGMLPAFSPQFLHITVFSSHTSQRLSASYVFIHHDAHRSPLHPSFDGFFRVLEAGPKTFIVDIGGGGSERVSVDHLKPAHVFPDEPAPLARAPRHGCPPNSGPVASKSPVPTSDPAMDSEHAWLI